MPLTIPSQGWAASRADAPPDDASPNGGSAHRVLERIGGGLEISIKFAHPSDRERVVEAARRVGWAPHGIVDDVEIYEQGMLD